MNNVNEIINLVIEGMAYYNNYKSDDNLNDWFDTDFTEDEIQSAYEILSMMTVDDLQAQGEIIVSLLDESEFFQVSLREAINHYVAMGNIEWNPGIFEWMNKSRYK